MTEETKEKIGDFLEALAEVIVSPVTFIFGGPLLIIVGGYFLNKVDIKQIKEANRDPEAYCLSLNPRESPSYIRISSRKRPICYYGEVPHGAR